MQILAPSNPKFTDKQQVDYNITSLKKLSRDYKIPIIAISSFNRMNYTQTASFEAFKESGRNRIHRRRIINNAIKDIIRRQATYTQRNKRGKKEDTKRGATCLLKE